MKIAKQLLFLAFMMFLCISVAAADEKVGQATTPGPTVVSQTQYPFTVGSGEYTLYTRIFDFPAGVWSPKHMHNGNGVGIVLDGEVIENGKIYKAGESWTEYPGYVHEVGNAGTTPARVLSISLVPKGAEFSTIVK